ncbi:uncharacterized protein BcabD6B2_02200 [Babesia caballi]|uniref:Uncharacterized protein n=1 Tax=Babesia caballi TaxID=5871 RepID=A0AAV4LLU7_BABCB|nr:hypothetical protein BcabD6B2_02200 [Babesia caballi]
MTTRGSPHVHAHRHQQLLYQHVPRKRVQERRARRVVPQQPGVHQNRPQVQPVGHQVVVEVLPRLGGDHAVELGDGLLDVLLREDPLLRRGARLLRLVGVHVLRRGARAHAADVTRAIAQRRPLNPLGLDGRELHQLVREDQLRRRQVAHRLPHLHRLPAAVEQKAPRQPAQLAPVLRAQRAGHALVHQTRVGRPVLAPRHAHGPRQDGARRAGVPAVRRPRVAQRVAEQLAVRGGLQKDVPRQRLRRRPLHRVLGNRLRERLEGVEQQQHVRHLRRERDFVQLLRPTARELRGDVVPEGLQGAGDAVEGRVAGRPPG